ncbi:FliH/SctL family protein [Adhaeretor mobilis]|uniref:PEP-CTERM protein-sorting domain-containing protein n=1 Tax=Adhaeretor mobilis TaxID=1930276 RepID=A0A517MSH2_9BACT|nr:hypothetical protein [Adhaeretor mobilis]QDS97821.1 hypothetical protein HG15A2_10880 [Adhaeretor mobilis]
MLTTFRCLFSSAIALVLVLSVSTALASSPPSQFQINYDQGYDFGYTLGHELGFEVGLGEGATAGSEAGQVDGYDSGWEAAYQPAYDAVYDDAYDAGAIDSYDLHFATSFIEGFRDGEEYTQSLSSSGIDLSSGLFLSNEFPSGVILTSGGYNPSLGWGWPTGTSSNITITSSYSPPQDGPYWYDQGKSAGLTEGREVGEQEGYNQAYQPAYAEAFDAAFVDGESEGATLGELDGLEQGYDDGWEYATEFGEADGYNFGFAFQQSGGTLADLGVTEQQAQALASFRTSTQIPEPSSLLLAFGTIGLLCVSCKR